MTTDCIHCGQNPGEVCRGCHERTRRTAPGLLCDGEIETIRVRFEDGCATPKEGNMNERFSDRNRRRCESPNGFNHKLESWSLSDWVTATTGELGEAANIVKKLNRVRDGIPGNKETEADLRASLADELADVAIYLDLLAQAAGFDLESIREAKFQKTSNKIGYKEYGS